MRDSLHQGKQMTPIGTKPVYLYIIAVVAVLMPSVSYALGWEIQVVEPNTGLIEDLGVDLAVEANGIAHIVYFDNSDGGSFMSLMYKRSDADPSFIEDNTLDINKDPKAVLAMDANGVVYVVYPVVYLDSDKLVYKKKQNGIWSSRQEIDSYKTLLPYDAVVDNNGLLSVVYSCYTPEGGYEDANLILFSDGDRITVETHGNFQSGSLAIDSRSKPHLCYYDALNDVLRYAVKDSNSWSFETVDDDIGDVDSYVWGSASLALDSNGVPHISYYDFTNRNLKCANKLSGTWATQVVDDTAVVSRRSSIGIDSNNVVHICYQQLVDANVVSLKYAVGNAEQWQLDEVKDFDQPDAYLSIACDDDDRPHICFTVPSCRTVEYAVVICGDAAHPYPDGDADKNCVVDFFDLSLLGQYWLDRDCTLPDYCAGADLDENSVVDSNDLDILTETWLKCSLSDCF
jgi:hypothetical protein